MVSVPQPNIGQTSQPNVGTVHFSSWEKMQKSKPQGNSISGGSVLLAASAIHLGWGLWRPFVPNDLYLVLAIIFHFAVIIGVWLGAILVNRLSKQLIYYSCSVSIIVGNVLFIACINLYPVILIARLIIGMAHGVLYVVQVCHASENSTNEMRGRIVTIIGFQIATGYFISSILVFTWNEVLGGVSLGLAVAGGLLTLCLNYESVVFLIQKRQYQEALELMAKLRSESVISWPIQNDFDELKKYVEQTGSSKNIFQSGNTRPLGLVSVVHMISFVSNNLFINMFAISYALYLFRTDETPSSTSTAYAISILTIVRMFSGFIPLFFGDRIGRKSFIVYAGYIGGAVLLLTSILFVSLGIQKWMLAGFVISQASFGCGLEGIPHVITSEAFAQNKKAMSIAFVTTVEHLLHIGSFILYFALWNDPTFVVTILFLSPILMILLTGMIHWLLPETRMMPLSQCRNEYLGGVHRGATYSRENVNSPEQGITYAN